MKQQELYCLPAELLFTQSPQKVVVLRDLGTEGKSVMLGSPLLL